MLVGQGGGGRWGWGMGVSGCVGVGWVVGGRDRWRLCGYECVWRGGDGIWMRVWVWRDRLKIVMIVRVPVNLFTVMIVGVPVYLSLSWLYVCLLTFSLS